MKKIDPINHYAACWVTLTPSFAWHSLPLAEDVFQVGGREAGLELGDVLCVVDASGEELGEVGKERPDADRHRGVERLVQETQVDEGVVEDDRDLVGGDLC